MKQPPNSPIDLLAPASRGASDLPDIAEKPHVSYFPNFIPDHHQVFGELMRDFHRLKTTIRMDEVRGYRRTSANLLRMPARLNPADFARRLIEILDRTPDIGLNSLQPMSPVVAMLGGRTWAVTGRMPDNAQICLYEDGNDYCGAHTDDATLLGPEVDNVIVAIYSFGAPRLARFYRQSTYRPDVSGHSDQPADHELLLEPGSLLLMYGETQTHWLHEIPQMQGVGPRLSVSHTYYQPKGNLAKAPWKLLQLPRPRIPNFGLTRHLGTPQACLARWEQIRIEEGIAPSEVTDEFRRLMMTAEESVPRVADFDSGAYEAAAKSREEKIAVKINEALSAVLPGLKIGPDVALLSPRGKDFDYSGARGRFGEALPSRPYERSSMPGRPDGVDEKLWSAMLDLVEQAKRAD